MRRDSGTKILLTGLPSCGKTTAVMKVVEQLPAGRAAGFYTQEIREAGKRKGFRWRRLDGAEGILAHVDFKSRCKVGSYGVDIAGFERSVVPVLDVERSDVELFVVDEIGKMECFSEKFIAAVRSLLASDKAVLATVAQKGGGFIREVKDHPGVTLITLTSGNREEVIAAVSERLLSGKGR
jgi:nucleoside-triphosphatase